MTESENPHLSFDNLPRSVAELHEKIDRLTGMFEQIVSSTAATPSPEIMTVGDVCHALQVRFHHLCDDFRTQDSIPQAGQQTLFSSFRNPIMAYGFCCSERYTQAQTEAAE